VEEPVVGEADDRRSEDAGTDGDHDSEPTAVAAMATAIFRMGLAISVEQARRWYDRSKEQRTWSPEDVVGDYTNLFEHFTPVAEKAINLTLDTVRPAARAITEQRR